MKATLRKLYADVRRRAASVDAILTTWLARKPTKEKLRRLEARCAALEREALAREEQSLGDGQRAWRAFFQGHVTALEKATTLRDTARSRRRVVSFSPITLDCYEDEPSIVLDKIVAGKSPKAAAFPVESGQSIRLAHAREPSFLPRYLEVSLELSDGTCNYHDYQLQLLLVGPASERAIGEPILGSRFHGKDGSRIPVSFPRHNGNPVIVGSLEHLEVLIHNRGTTSALIAASVGVGLCGGREPNEQRLA
jgi:hypothetical protein